MKNTLAFLFLFASFLGRSQEVSPFYPAKYVGDKPARFTSQMTYFDLNFISIHVSEFLTYKMAMDIEKTDSSKLLHDGGKLTITYSDRFSQSGSQKLSITYDVVKVNDVFTIEAVKITGDKKRIVSFFINFWKTTIHFDEPSGNSDVSLHMGQDDVNYFFNKGNPYIAITNGTYKNAAAFRSYFATLKAKQ